MAETSVVRLNSLAEISRGAAPVQQAVLSILPDAAKFVFRGRTTSIAAAGKAFGLELPQSINRFSEAGNRKACCLGPDEWLLEAIDETPAGLFAKLSNELASHSCSLVDVSHRSDGIMLSGAKSEYVLNHGCPLDLSLEQFPVGMCTRTLLGKSPIILSRTGPAVFHIDVWRSFSQYVWGLLDEARQELQSDQP